MSNKNGWDMLEDLGDAVSEIIDAAISSKDYQKLHKTVVDAVERTVENNRSPLRRTDTRRNKNIYSSKISSLNRESPPPQPKENLPVLYRNTTGDMVKGIVKTALGGVITMGAGIDVLVSLILRSYIGAFAGVFLLAGGALLYSGVKSIGRLERYRKYVRLLGQKTHITIEQLARHVGKPTKFVKKELPRMIDSGYFLEGHLDAEGTTLITSNETYRHYEQSRVQLQQRLQQEAQEAKRRAADPRLDPQVQQVLDRGSAYLTEIRRCNDAIPGIEISQKISRMENIIRKIIERAQSHPEIVPDLKKMMDYYLPMTVKLLNAYADMDAQPVQGETIQSSKREIEQTLDTLNLAFEKLLDNVFKETALDVSSDISVLQTLLAQEGLTEDDFSKLKHQ